MTGPHRDAILAVEAQLMKGVASGYLEITGMDDDGYRKFRLTAKGLRRIRNGTTDPDVTAILHAGAAYQFKGLVYGATGGLPISDAPVEFWRRIDIHYPSGKHIAIAYLSDPGEAELAALMFKIQLSGNLPKGATVQVIFDDGRIEYALVIDAEEDR
jgi:hypothetical protein